MLRKKKKVNNKSLNHMGLLVTASNRGPLVFYKSIEITRERWKPHIEFRSRCWKTLETKGGASVNDETRYAIWAWSRFQTSIFIQMMKVEDYLHMLLTNIYYIFFQGDFMMKWPSNADMILGILSKQWWITTIVIYPLMWIRSCFLLLLPCATIRSQALR